MKLYYLGIFCILLGESLALEKSYDGFKLYKVFKKSRSAGKTLQKLFQNIANIEFFSENNVEAQVLVGPDSDTNFLELLKKLFIEFEILNQDVGQNLKKQFEENLKLRQKYPFDGDWTTKRYYNHTEINLYISKLAQKSPQRVTVETVGKSYEGRPLDTITITNGDGRKDKNVILMDAGYHAREWIAFAAALYAVRELVENFDENAHLLEDYDWIILPAANPDGYEYSQEQPNTRLWRKTRKPNGSPCIGTDPNRNFDFQWNITYSSMDPCDVTYSGPAASSEPEVRVMEDLMDTLSERGHMYLSLHTYGRYILYPWGYTRFLAPNWRDQDKVARAGASGIWKESKRIYRVGPIPILYPVSGCSIDYAYNAGFPYSLVMELTSVADNFNPPASDIDGFAKEAWAGIKAMAEKVIEKNS